MTTVSTVALSHLELSNVQRTVLPTLGLLAFCVDVTLPLVRSRLRDGAWPVSLLHDRPAAERWAGYCLSFSLAAVGVWCICLRFVDPKHLFIWPVPEPVQWAVLSIIVVLLILVTVTQAQMGSAWRMGVGPDTASLVSRGLFQFVRHPIYTLWTLIGLAVVFITPSPWTIMGFIWLASSFGTQARMEEQHLLSVHGNAYAQYAQRVGRFIPGFGRLPYVRDRAPATTTHSLAHAQPVRDVE